MIGWSWRGPARHGLEFFPPALAVRLAKRGELIGAIVFNNYTRSNIEASVMGEMRAFTSGVVRSAAADVAVSAFDLLYEPGGLVG